ncbi:MAG: hypothetical protein IPK26_16415 [Planctomycetes bacterium]|nr:hypothetical protein [Planctomycetota bacterium]
MLRFLHHLLTTLLRLALPAALGWWLAGRYATGPTVGIAAGVFAVLAFLGCVLLRLSSVGQISGLNRVGGLLLPFAWRFGRGSLARMAIGATALQTVLATAGALARNGGVGAPGGSALLVLIVAWTVDGLAVLWIVHLMHGYRVGSSGGNGMLRVILFLLIVIAASAVLHHYGWTWLGVLVAGLPPACVGAYFGLYMALFMFGGKNRRWN